MTLVAFLAESAHRALGIVFLNYRNWRQKDWRAYDKATESASFSGSYFCSSDLKTFLRLSVIG
jgi:hypothetical protein